MTQEAENIFRAIDDGRPEYKWSEILKKDELHTGRRILLAYGLQFTNQMGGAPLIVVCEPREHRSSKANSMLQTYVTTGKTYNHSSL